MKIRPVGAELFVPERQTDMTKVTVVFRSFANSPKGEICRPVAMNILAPSTKFYLNAVNTCTGKAHGNRYRFFLFNAMNECTEYGIN